MSSRLWPKKATTWVSWRWTGTRRKPAWKGPASAGSGLQCGGPPSLPLTPCWPASPADFQNSPRFPNPTPRAFSCRWFSWGQRGGHRYAAHGAVLTDQPTLWENVVIRPLGGHNNVWVFLCARDSTSGNRSQGGPPDKDKTSYVVVKRKTKSLWKYYAAFKSVSQGGRGASSPEFESSPPQLCVQVGLLPPPPTASASPPGK